MVNYQHNNILILRKLFSCFAQPVLSRGADGIKLGLAPLGSESKQHLEAFARGEDELI